MTDKLRLVTMPEGQWSEDFINKMKARMFVGFYRYGDTKRYAESGKYSITETIKKYLAEYEKDGNLEHIVNIANYCLIEYMYPQHPNSHFLAIEEEDKSKRIGVVETVEVMLKAEKELNSDLRGSEYDR